LHERTARVATLRCEDAGAVERADAVVREEPLEIRLGGAPLAVVMRTPGDDEELALGFLVSERVVRSARDVVSVRHCPLVAGPESEDNAIQVVLAPGVEVDLDALRRNLYASASCGICGKATLENALREAPALEDDSRFPAELLYGLPDRLTAAQPVFARTGGLHAAALFGADGRLLVAREDVGRHNAVDKVLGWALRRGCFPLEGHVLLVSGRVSYEIAQKALVARLPVVAAVSAPSSLAVELAERSGMALVGFLRGRSLNVYGRQDRIIPAPG
jgi:FdhD protein